jgi:hypothetical protein
MRMAAAGTSFSIKKAYVLDLSLFSNGNRYPRKILPGNPGALPGHLDSIIEKKSLKFKDLEHARIEKVVVTEFKFPQHASHGHMHRQTRRD